MKKLRLWVKLVLVIFIFIGGYLLYRNNNVKEINNESTLKNDIIQVDYVSKIAEIIGDIDKDFLKWVNSQYPESLVEIYNYLKNNEYDKKVWHQYIGYSYNVLNDLYNNEELPIVETKDDIRIHFVGDVSLADNWQIMPEYDKRNKGIYGILSEDVVKILNDSSFLVVNSEFTVSNRGTPLKGKAFTFEAKPERLKIYYEMGVDLALLANNHVYDFGHDAFIDMLDYFKEYKIPAIGAGHNLEEASKPYNVIINGYKFSFLNCTRAEKNIMTPGADNNSEGVLRCYDTTNMVNAIKSARTNSDYVIANVHFGKEGSHSLEEVQIKSAKEYIDAGADMVVGHHAHVLQGIEIYKDKPIIYNLGNFIFNKNELDTAIFEVRMDNDGNLDYYIIPGIQKDEYTSLANETNKKRIINNLNKWSINVNIDEFGHILKKS